MSTAKDRLRRSKSTRSVPGSYDYSLAAEPFDPNLARLHATVAASRAMSSSAGRSSTLLEGSYDRIGGPRRMAVPQRRYRHTRSFYSSDDSGAVVNPPSCHSTAYHAEKEDHDSAWSAALPSISEFGGLDDRIASLPSSYRRLRKTRSMFSTRQCPSRLPNGSSSSESHSPGISSRGPTSNPPRLQRSLRRSMSFLRGDCRPPGTLRHAKSHDVAIQLARFQHEQNAMNTTTAYRWPPLPSPKARPAHKPFRKTFRTTSTSEMTSITSSSIEQIKATSSHGKARSFSSSIKRGIKRVLGLSKTTSEQVQMQESPSSRHNQAQSPATVVSIDDDHQADGRPSLHIDKSGSLSGLSRPPAVRRMQSSESLATSRSRVTSWADSTAASTITSPGTGGQQHLSIIDEHKSPGQADSHSLHSVSVQQQSSNSLDSHSLFSALMKRIGGMAEQASDEEVLLGRVKEHRAIPTQGALHLRRSRQTIRQVSSNGSIGSPKSFATANAGPATPYVQAQPVDTGNIRNSSDPADAWERHDEPVLVEGIRAQSISPSVYSRTTNGHSPGSKAVTDSSDSEGELGVATIFASERTTYSSPSKRPQSPVAESSSEAGPDWQNWMDSQMARIENATPPRHHYREDAQIQDDYEPAFESSFPARKIRVRSRSMNRPSDGRDGLSRKVSTNSNFSRPFSRSSSVRTIVMAPKENVSNTPATSVPISASDDVFRVSGGRDSFFNPAHTGQQDIKLSPMRSRSSNQPRVIESPTPKRYTTDVPPQIGSGGYGRYTSKLSAPSQDGRTLQRRPVRFNRENKRITDENARLKQGPYDRPYDLQSPISSKRMVEIFLNSRRRQTGADMADDGTSETAFL